MGVPVYLFTGFLESGKTTLIKDTIASPDFADVASTLLILCEEGEEEYDPAFCSEHQVTVVTVENKEDMTEKLLEGFAGAYDAEQVMIEYNGTWEMDLILDMDMPCLLYTSSARVSSVSWSQGVVMTAASALCPRIRRTLSSRRSPETSCVLLSTMVPACSI